LCLAADARHVQADDTLDATPPHTLRKAGVGTPAAVVYELQKADALDFRPFIARRQLSPLHLNGVQFFVTVMTFVDVVDVDVVVCDTEMAVVENSVTVIVDVGTDTVLVAGTSKVPLIMVVNDMGVGVSDSVTVAVVSIGEIMENVTPP
jgi:hypothetical protein